MIFLSFLTYFLCCRLIQIYIYYYQLSTVNQTQEKHAESIADTSKYWGELASQKLDWFSPFTHVQNGSFTDGSISWFLNGKLNTSYNAIDRWCLGDGDRANDVAIRWEGDEPSATRDITFSELLTQTSKIANALKSQGVRKGDVVTIYMPMIPEIAMTMLACARIGAVHSVIFAGFSADAIAERIYCSKSKWVVTADVGKRGGKTLPLKKICDQGVEKDVCKGIVEKVFVFAHYSGAGKEEKSGVKIMQGRDVQFNELMRESLSKSQCASASAPSTGVIVNRVRAGGDLFTQVS